ncbi:MAG: hypothetical protein WBP45_02895 [Daejeonella sp.]
MIKQLLISIGLLQAALFSYGQNSMDMDIKSIKLFQENMDYPYIASEKRKAVILENMNSLKKGMTKNQVIELMTPPDEANLTYKSKKSKDNLMGFAMVYILERNQESGSDNEKGEKLIRIHFNKYGILVWAYSIKIDEFSAIGKE